MVFRLLPASAPTDAFAGWIEFAIRAIEGLAVAIIAFSVFVFTLRYLYYAISGFKAGFASSGRRIRET